MGFVDDGWRRGESPPGRDRRSRSRARPVVESLETRALMSGAAVGSHHGFYGSQPQGPFLNPAVIAASADLLYGPGSASPMTPTPREIKRQTFTARWIGRYTIGPPRFNDRASTIHFYGVDGGSNAFLKGKFQIALFPPADPNAAPTPGDPYAGQTTGVAALFPQNYLQTGGLLVLDLHGAQGNPAANGSLPRHLTWTFDTNSGGPFIAPVGFNQGAGTLDIVYRPSAHTRAGTLGSGVAMVTFQGLLNYSQMASTVSKYYS